MRINNQVLDHGARRQLPRDGGDDDQNALDSIEKVGTAFDRIRREYDAKAKVICRGKLRFWQMLFSSIIRAPSNSCKIR